MDRSVRDVVLDHNYDGIQEYDNPTPGWWWMLFNVTIVFSVVYFAYYQLSAVAPTVQDEYEVAVTEALREQFGEIGELKPDEPTMLRFLHDDKWLAVGRSTFIGKCASCHGRDANGLVGPNMTDDNYKNVKKLTDIATVIRDGAANGAMPSWKNQLHPNEVVLTACYIASLRGKNMPGPRGPEGDIIPPWPTAPAASQPEKADGK